MGINRREATGANLRLSVLNDSGRIGELVCEMIFLIALALAACGFFLYVLIQFHRDASSRRHRRY